MLKELMEEQKTIELESIGRLMDLEKFLTSENKEIEAQGSEECMADVMKLNLERSKIIHDLIINISRIIKGED